MNGIRRVLITLLDDNVAPRFDLATDVLIAEIDEAGALVDQNELVLEKTSGENLCHMVVENRVGHVICSGIEEELYRYLQWKNVEVYDSVIGSAETALARFAAGRLSPGDMLVRMDEDEQ